MNHSLSDILSSDKDYATFLKDIKSRLKTAQLRAASAVNTHVIQFYWQLGSDILKIQTLKQHWGSYGNRTEILPIFLINSLN